MDEASPSRRRRALLLVLEVFELVGAIVGTIGLLSDGEQFMGGTVSAGELPFESWVLAALSLLALNGLLPLVAVVAELRRHPHARVVHLVTGVVLMLWIVLQVALIGLVFFLQPLMFVLGAAIVALALADEPGTIRLGHG